MKNLHNITSTIKFSDAELSILYYSFITYPNAYQFKIEDGKLYWKRVYALPWDFEEWYPSIKGWTISHTLEKWIEAGKPQLTVVNNRAVII